VLEHTAVDSIEYAPFHPTFAGFLRRVRWNIPPQHLAFKRATEKIPLKLWFPFDHTSF